MVTGKRKLKDVPWSGFDLRLMLPPNERTAWRTTIVETDQRFEDVDPLIIGRQIQKQVLERASSRARSDVTSALK